VRIGGIELRRVRKDVVTAPFVPNAGKNPPPGIAQSMDAQGMGYQRPFSPGTPLAPWLSYGGEPRAWDYQTGFNISTRPRNGLVSFDTIGQICYSYDWARICRKRRIDSFRSFDWSIVPADGQSGDLTSAIEAGRAAIAKPDGIAPYKQWIAKYLWDLFTYDAGSLYKRRDVTGRVYALDVVDGTSIAPLVDYDGRQPTPPAPAFVQFVMGLPFDWQTASDLIYEPFWPVPNSPYGQAPIEDVLLTANTDMRMTMGLLDDWTDGNIPGGWGEAPAEMTDPAAIQELEDRLNGKLQQDQKVKVQVHLVPAGFKFTPNRKQSFDEPAYLWLARKTCAAFGVVPEDVGITQDVNRATADTQMDVQERVSDRPLAEHIDGILTAYLQDDLGLPVKMQTTYAAEKEDRVSEAQVWKIGIEAGAASVDDMRQEMFGLTVDTERPVPRFIMTSHAGPVPLADLFAIAGPIDPETAAPAESIPLVDTHAKPLEPVSGLLPGKTINTPGAVVTTFNPDEPQFPQAESLTVPPPTTIAAVAKAETSGMTSQTGMTGHDLGTGEDEDDEDVRKELSRWRDNARGRVKLGKAPRQFASTILPVPLWTAVWKALEGATTRTQVDAAFAEAAKSADFFLGDVAPVHKAHPLVPSATVGSIPALGVHVRDVVLLGPQEEMVRVHAAPVVAVVQNQQTSGNRPVEELPGNPVGKANPMRVAAAPASPMHPDERVEVPVAPFEGAARLGTKPVPTPVTKRNPAPESQELFHKTHYTTSRANPTAAVAYPVRKAKHPTDALLDQIVGHYAPLVGQALASALPSQSRLAQGNLTPADLDLSQLLAVLTEAKRDAWVGGALIAADAVKR
jgi:hypothetical protein